MEFDLGPSPAEMARMLVVTWAVALAAILVASRLRRRRNRFISAAAGLLFFAAAATLILTGFSLVYPHHHHDVWRMGKWDYPIDAAIGVVYWGTLAAAYRWGWKGAEVR